MHLVVLKSEVEEDLSSFRWATEPAYPGKPIVDVGKRKGREGKRRLSLANKRCGIFDVAQLLARCIGRVVEFVYGILKAAIGPLFCVACHKGH
jgi:hypothetical protein